MSLITLFCVFAWVSYLFPRHAITGVDILVILAIGVFLALMSMWGVA
jgi:hypothetical protein